MTESAGATASESSVRGQTTRSSRKPGRRSGVGAETQPGRKEALYGILLLGMLVVEAVALGALIWAFLFRERSLTHEKLGDLGRALIGFVAFVALALALVTAFILVAQAVRVRRARRAATGASVWGEIWPEVLFADRQSPKDPLPAEAVAALLDLREELPGSDSLIVGEAIIDHGVDALLLSRVGPHRPPRGSLGRSLGLGFRRARLPDRLDALEGLAKARVPTALGSLFLLFDDEEAAVRRMAARAAGRTIAEMPSGPELTHAQQALATALERGLLPPGVVEETIILLEDNAAVVIGVLLETSRSETLTVVALDCAGKLGATDLAPRIGTYLDPAQPAELRAAALRASTAMSLLPPGTEKELRASLSDRQAFVRVQATHAATLLPHNAALEVLREQLEDPSWWVRRAAALGLAQLGTPGREALETVARSTGDRFSREMAVLVLQDRGWVELSRARSLLAAS